MRKFIFIFMILLCCSCYHSRYLGDDFEPQEKQEQVVEHKYMLYQNTTLDNFEEVHVIMLLEDLEIPNHFISINRVAEVENSEIKIMIDNIFGTYKRYLHIFVFSENGIDITINDTIKIE